MSKIDFQFNKQKAIEVILYLADKDTDITKLKLLKYLFLADLYHLDKYSRPIVGGRYVAMPKGPVLSEMLNLINEKNTDFKLFNKFYISCKRQAETDYFSTSDIEALDYAVTKYSKYSAEELSDMTHDHPAWFCTRAENPASKNAHIDYLKMKPNITDEERIFLEEMSGLMVF